MRINQIHSVNWWVIKMDYSNVKWQENGKLKLLIIVGTRPEIIRLSAVINKTRKYFDVIKVPKKTVYGEMYFPTTVVTGKGQIWLLNKLKEEYVN